VGSIGRAAVNAHSRAAATGWVIGVGAALAALAATGSSARDVLIWPLVIGAGVLLPGVAVTRATRRTPVSLGDDIAWAIPVGLAVALLGWCFSRLVQTPGWLWGLVVAALVMAAPAARRRALAAPRGRWGAPTSWSLAGVVVVAVAWMTREYLQWTPVDPGPHGHVYYIDSAFHAAMFAELSRPGLPTYPMVAGQPLSYHWFPYAILGNLGSGTGLDRFDMALRLTPVALVLGTLLLIVAVARQLSGRPLAGPLAAALFAVVGASTPTLWSAVGVGSSMVNTYWWVGPPQPMGWITGLAVLGAGLAVVRRAPSDRAAPAALLPVLVMLTAGAKSSVLPVMVCGFALACGVAVLRRDWRQTVRTAFVTVLIVVVLGVAAVTIYEGQSYGLRIAPGVGLETVARAVFPGLERIDPNQVFLLRGHLSPAVLATGAVLWLVPQLIRALGVGWLIARRPSDPGTWVVLGCGVGGLAAFALLRHPGSSEVFFPISAFPMLVVGSAAGLATVLPAGRELRRRLPTGLAFVGIGFIVAAVTALAAGASSPLVRWRAGYGQVPNGREVSALDQIWAWSWPLLSVLAASVVLGLVVLVFVRRWTAALGAGLASLLGVGCFATVALITGATQPSIPEQLAANHSGRPPALTRDLVAAGSWLAKHDHDTDVVAVNRACLPLSDPDPQVCHSQDFTITWATGLRSDVEGWAYAGRNVEAAWDDRTLPYSAQPFWDQARLGAELQAFTDPTAAGYDALYDSGVRWLLADRPTTPLPLAGMDALADRELTLGTVTLWRLRPP
jgi:hypothetical protein